ncbi:MAG TPA: hypothetical protein VGY13_00950 [Solirubrobacteraceae bacterium]|nr:hypothetical protein [Solirubrobacteraceae bacterium]
MQFRITPHSAVAPPADAIEKLWQLLDSHREGLLFTRQGAEIEAQTEEDPPVSMTRDEREEIGRLAVLRVINDVCDEAPELSEAWYAVSSEL